MQNILLNKPSIDNKQKKECKNQTAKQAKCKMSDYKGF